MLEFSYSIHICSVHNIFCSKKHSKTVVMLSFNSFFVHIHGQIRGEEWVKVGSLLILTLNL